MGSLAAADEPLPPLRYPPARRDGDIVNDYHGVLVPDPYRWMEELESEEVKEFVGAQAAVADAVLATCDHRGRLRGQLTALLDHPRYRAPFKRAGTYFYFHNPGLLPHSALYVQHGLGGEPSVLLDPSEISDDATVSLSMIGVSDDGEHLAYGTSASGSDWVTIRAMRVRDKRRLPDTLSWVKFSRIAWTRDGEGFFYSRFPAPKGHDGGPESGIRTDVNLNHEVYYHFLGTDQSDDVMCWRDPEHPKYIYTPEVTEDGKYVLLSVSESSEPVNKLYYCDLSALSHGLSGIKGTHEMLPFVKLVDKFEAFYGVVANDGTRFTVLTNKDSPRYKLSRVDVDDPQSWTDVLPEDDRAVLESACAVHGDKLLVNYLSDVKYVLQMRSLVTGELLHGIPIDIGSVNRITGRRADSEVFIEFSSFLTPGIVYRCDLSTGVPEMNIYREITVPGFDRTDFEAKQGVLPEQGRDQDPDVRRVEEEHRPRRVAPGAALRLRRVRHEHDAAVQRGPRRPHEEPRIRDMRRQHPRRRGVRGGLAQGRLAREQAELLRRLRRRRRVPRLRRIHEPEPAVHRRREQRRAPGRRLHQPGSWSLRLCSGSRGRHGHASVSQVHHRSCMDLRFRLLGERGGIPLANQVLPSAQREAAVGEARRRRPAPPPAVPSHHAADGGPRRPRRAVAHPEVPRDDAARPVRERGAEPADQPHRRSDRPQERTRLRPLHAENHRRGCGSLRLRGEDDGGLLDRLSIC